MRNKYTIKNLFVVACIISSLLVRPVSVFAVESGDNSAMKLSTVQGTVAVLDKNNKPKKATDNMKLLSGNKIVTNIGSYAWVNLDSNKLVKQDALSKVEITKDEKNLTIDVRVGKVFVDVSKNLEKDESLIIRTPNTIISIENSTAEIGINGEKTQILCLGEKINGFALDTKNTRFVPIEVASGKIVSIENTNTGLNIKSNSATKKNISGFAKLQIAQDPILKAKIVKAVGTKRGNIDLNDAIATLLQDTNKQLAEIENLANAVNTDKQSVINLILGADVSSEYLERLAASTQDPSSDTTPSTSDGSTSNDKAADAEQKHTHNYKLTSSTPASCTNEGSNTYSCKGCGAVKTVKIPKIAHDYEEIIIAQPTCIAEGSREFRCRACGYSITETLSIIEHSYNGDVKTREAVDNPHNCQDYYIVESKYCTMCESYIDQPRQHKYLEHSMEYVGEVSPATCETPRMVKYKCSIVLNSDSGLTCSYEYECFEGSQLDYHEYGTDKNYLNTSSDTCYYYTCVNCGQRGEEMPHTLDDTSVLPETDTDLGDKYIKCAEDECSMCAKYSWNAESNQYVFTGSWENHP